MFLFKPKKREEPKEQGQSKANIDLEIITKMNQEFASSLDLNETLNTALKVIISRINAQAANIFLINDKRKKFQCIASLYQDYLDEYELDLKDGVMGRAVSQRKCIRVGDVRKDVREIAEFYFDLDNKTNFTTFSVLCSPLIAANECIGVIHCLNKKTDNKLFQENDRQLLETLSAPAAFAIRNAKMAKEMIEKNKIQKEVEIVGDIQKSLLSKNKTNSFQETKVSGIYAAGDCAGPHEIVHIAIRQGETAARHAMGELTKPISYDHLLGVVFTDPQVASVGLLPKELDKRGIKYLSADYPFDDHGKSILMEAKHGYVAVHADKESGVILGAECVGKDAGELIHTLSIAVSLKASVHQLAQADWYHPTLAEIWTYPIEDLVEEINQQNQKK